MELFGGLQLLTPLGLLAGLGVPLLVFAYLRREAGRKRVVSSVLVLRELTRRPARRRRFSPPLRFFLELLALLLFVLSGTLPTRLKPQNTIAVVVDNSFSMRASASAGANVSGSGMGNTRFALAQDRAAEWALEQSRELMFVVYASAPRLTLVGSESGVSRNGVRDLVRRIEPTLTGDSLEVSLRELAQSGKYERVVIFSDRAPEYGDADGASDDGAVSADAGKGGSVQRSTRVIGNRIGGTEPNLWISRFGVVRESIPEPHDELAVTISTSIPASSGARGVQVRVVFSEVLANGERKALGESVARVNGPAPQEVRHAIDSGTSGGPTGRVFQAVVRRDDRGEDALAEDNTAWCVDAAEGGNSLLLVGAGAGDDLGLRRIPGLGVEAVTSEAFNALTPEMLNRYSLLLFHRVAPNRAIERPTLFVLPPQDNTIFPVAGGVVDPRIASWREEHPLAAYLKVPLLNLGATEIFEVPLWAETVIKAEQGSILVAGESRGIRLVATGFEILPFEGAKTPAPSVLLLNILHWLSGTTSFGEGLVTGGSVRLQGGTWQVVLPTGERSTVSAGAERGDSKSVPGLARSGETVLQTALAGIYRLTGPGNEQRTVAVNLYHGEESQTGVDHPYATPRVVVHAEHDPDQSTPLWPWLLLGGLALIFGEVALASAEAFRLARSRAAGGQSA